MGHNTGPSPLTAPGTPGRAPPPTPRLQPAGPEPGDNDERALKLWKLILPSLRDVKPVDPSQRGRTEVLMEFRGQYQYPVLELQYEYPVLQELVPLRGTGTAAGGKAETAGRRSIKPDKALSGTEGWSRRESVEPNTRQAAGQQTALTTCTSRGTTAGGGGSDGGAHANGRVPNCHVGCVVCVVARPAPYCTCFCRGSVVSGLRPLNAKVNTRRDALRRGYPPPQDLKQPLSYGTDVWNSPSSTGEQLFTSLFMSPGEGQPPANQLLVSVFPVAVHTFLAQAERSQFTAPDSQYSATHPHRRTGRHDPGPPDIPPAMN
ncbi:unnamed protein product [Boreogadus saida]